MTRQKELESKTKHIRKVNEDLLAMITEYESKYAPIVVNGEHIIEELKVDVENARKVGYDNQ